MMNKAGHTITERQVITSAANADVKLLRSLHERKFRKQTGWFLAEGLRICTEALHKTLPHNGLFSPKAMNRIV